MRRFIKLTNKIINISSIQKIECHENQYSLLMNNNHITGVFIMSSGFINSNSDYIVIYKDKNPMDYEIITKFIDDIQ